MKLIYISLFAFVLSGCAITPQAIPPVSGASLVSLKTEKIAVIYSFAEKRINYSETLYRVLWLEDNSSSEDVSGIWNPDLDATQSAVVRLRKQGFSADSIHDVVDATLVRSYTKKASEDCIENSIGISKIVPGAKASPNPAFFLKNPNSEEFFATSNALINKNYRYLVEVNAMNINGVAPGYGMVIVSAHPNVRVIDLQSNHVVWSGQLYHGEVYQLGGDLKALEKDGMRKAKEGLAAGIEKLDFSAVWGIKPG